MEISKIVNLLEEAINKKAHDLEEQERVMQSEQALFRNDLKALSNLIKKHAPESTEEKE